MASSLSNPILTVDPVGALIALANANAGEKLATEAGQYRPQSKEQATHKLFGSYDAYIPNILQPFTAAASRTFYGESAGDLQRFNRLFPFVNATYPIYSLYEGAERSDELLKKNEGIERQNKIIKELWDSILNGIETLQHTYKSTTEKPMPPHSFSYIDGFDLEWKPTLDATFVNWNRVIPAYKIQPMSPIDLNAIMGDVNTVGETVGHVEAAAAAAAPSKKGKVRQEESRQTSFKNLIERWVQEIQSFPNVAVVNDLRTILITTLNQGKVPKNLFLLSEKVKEVWPIEALEEAIGLLKKIKNPQESVFDRKLAQGELNKMLEKKSIEYSLVATEALKAMI